MDDRPIGIFDSGIGGTSIWGEIQELMPYENCIYLADSKYAPYGEKSQERILELSIKNTEYLLNQNCKLIVFSHLSGEEHKVQNLPVREEFISNGTLSSIVFAFSSCTNLCSYSSWFSLLNFSGMVEMLDSLFLSATLYSILQHKK